MTRQQISKNLILLLVIAFFALNAIFATYHVFFSNRIIPGTKVGKVSIGGLTKTQALAKLKNSAPSQDTKLFFGYKRHTYSASLQELNLQYDWERTIQRAVLQGRSGNLVEDTMAKLKGMVGANKIKPVYTFDEKAFQAFTAKIDGAVNIQKQDAYFELKDNTLAIVPEKEGSIIEIEALSKELQKNFDNLEFKLSDIPVKKVTPEITSSDLQDIQPKVEQIIGAKIDISSNKDGVETVTPTKEQILKYLKFQKTQSAAEKISISVDTTKTGDIVNAANLLVYESPRGKVTKLDGTKVVEFEIEQEGAELDKEAFLKDFTQIVLNPSIKEKDNETAETQKVTLKTISTSAPNNLEKYGIKELIGTGTSKYVGSIASREKNIELATERLNGILVPPGGLFSFNKSVGEISAATGYAQAYVITNGRTVLGDGGGVCQTSTTVFRAALNSGLEIITRHPHAYRVYYYEQESPVGFDASIYQPSLDFVFRNDTDNFILLQTSFNREEKKLTYEIYGTPDGRRVEISKPSLTDQIAPPEPKEIEDPNLPKGQKVQTEHATWGAKAMFTRKVLDADGDSLHNDTFTSVYRPWGDVYMVGTKE
jgi:vancomycin resistance protein YoaR